MSTFEDDRYRAVVEANVALHSRMADDYDTCEPHFRPENVAQVESNLARIVQRTGAKRLLDLGCGTGFIINIARSHVEEIHGVDAAPAMLEKVVRSGPARIELHLHDTGTFPVDAGAFDIVTAYSFLHHLYDIRPTLRTAARALRAGGQFYADLEPNFYFWEALGRLERHGDYDPIVKREIEMVTYKDEDIERRFGVTAEVFNQAEFGKSVKGGFREEELTAELHEVGFQQIDFCYHWFLGQGQMINDPQVPIEERFQSAKIVDRALRRVLPLSRSLFKYVGFVATR